MKLSTKGGAKGAARAATDLRCQVSDTRLWLQLSSLFLFPCAPGGFYLYNIWGGVGGDAHLSFAGGRKRWKCIFLINGPPLPSPLSLLVLSLMNSNVVHFVLWSVRFLISS